MGIPKSPWLSILSHDLILDLGYPNEFRKPQSPADLVLQGAGRMSLARSQGPTKRLGWKRRHLGQRHNEAVGTTVAHRGSRTGNRGSQLSMLPVSEMGPPWRLLASKHHHDMSYLFRL